MNSTGRDIFKAIHEGKWLSIEYRNNQGSLTRYWIGIYDIDTRYKRLRVEGLHLGNFRNMKLTIYIDKIESTKLLDGTYQPVNERLIEDINLNPNKYAFIFTNTANLKILNYLADCNKLDSIPYKSEYDLIERIDGDKLTPAGYILDEEQFRSIVNSFRKRFETEYQQRKVTQLCLNLLSINTKKGLYVLAYRRLELDVKSRTLRPCEEVTICKEFTIAGEKESIRQFLDADNYYLLEDYEKNAETIKDRITASNRQVNGVDDMPYLICIESDHLVDLSTEYREILDMYDEDRATVPVRAFFGDLTAPSRRRKDYPITLMNNKINLDQLLAIHNALKYPVTYVQGPPGTGKSNTIVNTVISAFFNERTVLFSSYNNHPIDGVFDILTNLKYRERIIPFPVLRIGSNKKVEEAIERIRALYEFTRTINIYSGTLSRNKSDKTERTQKLMELLKKHEELIELKERRDAISDLHKLNDNMSFQTDLEQRQLYQVQQRMKEIGNVTDEEALSLLTDDQEDFRKYLFYMSAMYIKRLEEPKYADFLKILDMSSKEERITEFNRWLSEGENLRKLQRVFPVMATTCISAHKLGTPTQYFDMVIMDEASQCNTAMSLVPIIRGNNLMLVGDPQQLNPVVLLDSSVNESLRKKYNVAPEYDYISNSVYKTFLACDSVSNEILLSYHYRCDKKIIEFNNKKYYNGRLKIKTGDKSETPLIFSDIQDNTTDYKNTAPTEADKIVQFVKMNREKSIGIITPFANQRDCIQKALHEARLDNITCGTVHAFQGDEKDIILFSLALTDKTNPKTYDWLKNNRELVNVAVSRAKEQLIVLSSRKELERLHEPDSTDDIYELVNYVRSNGRTEVTPKNVSSRALGIKPYSTETEEAFLQNLNHALDNILLNEGRCSVEREVAISQVFSDNISCSDLFYTGRFDFVIYQRDYSNRKMPVLAIELDGKEHIEDEIVRERDRKKNKICRDHGFELIRVENSYARRYNFIKSVLIDYFGKRRR
ncbi:MAG: AAA domain-containing protein [Ruminococcus sp.]|nr:AAA domain-containing protein [Ruminococcus sp.]